MTSPEFLASKVNREDLEQELRRNGLLGKFWSSQPNRDFDDLPTVCELLDWIEANRSAA